MLTVGADWTSVRKRLQVVPSPSEGRVKTPANWWWLRLGLECGIKKNLGCGQDLRVGTIWGTGR